MDAPPGYINFMSKDRIELSDWIETSCCGKIDVLGAWLGLTFSELKHNCFCNVDAVFKKSENKPRFEPKFPYPHGY